MSHLCFAIGRRRKVSVVGFFLQGHWYASQIREPKNQASDDKAERMHCTILNMARGMKVEFGLPLSFWCDTAVYAAYIVNRSPSKANVGRQSPLQLLTLPISSDILVFGSPCTVHQDAWNNPSDLAGNKA